MKKLFYVFIIAIAFFFTSCRDNDNPVAVAEKEYYNEYIAILNQSGSKVPEAIIIKNTFKKPIYFIYLQSGTYMIWSSTSFPVMETIAFIEKPKGDSIRIDLMPGSLDDYIYLTSYLWDRPADNQINNLKLTIRAYK